MRIADQLTTYIERELPDLFPNPKIYNLRLSDNQGMESKIYFFTINFNEPNTQNKQSMELVLKLYTGIISQILFDPNKSVISEFNVSKTASLNGILVARVYSYSLKNNSYFESAFIILEKLEGTPIRQHLMKLKNSENNLEFIKHWNKIVSVVVRVHNMDHTDFLQFFPGSVNNQDPYSYMKHDLELWKDIIQDKEIRVIFNPLLIWLKSNIERVPLIRYSLVHRDILYGNIFYTTNQDIFVLDWGLSYITDFRLDLGYILMGIQLDNEFNHLRDHYLQMYKSLVDYPVDEIEFFEVLAIIKNLMIDAVLLKFKFQITDREELMNNVLKNKSFILLKKIAIDVYPELALLIESNFL